MYQLWQKPQAQPLAVTEEGVSPKTVQCSYATAAAPRGESVSEGKVGGASSVNTHVSSPGRLVADSEKKFNVVIYGISECPKDTPRSLKTSLKLSQSYQKSVAPFSHRQLKIVTTWASTSSTPKAQNQGQIWLTL